MDSRKRRIRVFVRRWTPRVLPYPVTEEEIRRFVRRHHEQFNAFVYAGWARRKNVQQVQRIGFFIATGSSRKEAKKKFRESNEFGKDIWEVID